MEEIMSLIAWATANGPQFIAAINAAIVALIALSLMIPGDQPEAFLKGVADFLAKFSSKPKA